MIGIRKDNTFTRQKEVIGMYNAGLTQKQVSKKLGICLSYVGKILIKNNMSRRMTEYRRYSVDHCFFKKINSEESAYILGFIFADGYIKSNGRVNELRILVHKKDKYVLEVIKEKLKYEGHIKVSRDNYTYLSISSEKLVDDLKNHGAVNRKTHNLIFPKLQKEMIRHFIRGYFDGDGSVFKDQGKTRVAFTGHLPFLDKLSSFLPVPTKKIIDKRTHNHGTVRINKQRDVLLMGYFLYNGSTIYLNRKFKKWGDIS